MYNTFCNQQRPEISSEALCPTYSNLSGVFDADGCTSHLAALAEAIALHQGNITAGCGFPNLRAATFLGPSFPSYSHRRLYAAG